MPKHILFLNPHPFPPSPKLYMDEQVVELTLDEVPYNYLKFEKNPKTKCKKGAMMWNYLAVFGVFSYSTGLCEQKDSTFYM